MGMKALEELRDMLCREVDEIAEKGELSAGDLDTAHKLTDTIKNIDKIEMLEEGGYSEDDGMSYRGGNSRNGGMWQARGGYDRNSYDGGYDRGNSYQHRNRMGRYSRADGVQDLMQSIEEMMHDNSLNTQQKEALRRAKDALNK